MRPFIVLIASLLVLSPFTVAGDEVDYVKQVKPILVARCYACHSALRKKSGLRVDTAAELISGGDAGPAVVPGKSADSYLISMLTGESGTRMPPENEGAALTAEQIAIFKKWIDEGAHAPAETPLPDPRDHWSYHPPSRPAVPKVRNAGWVRNPIDSFIAAGQESQGLSPAAATDKSTLLRRVYLDLVGLPPTRDELTAFLADDSPNAYDAVVDRLLVSPQYGERWARHWMDVWRYSDWSGYKEEIRNSARHIWRWRDWIVESLNEDKGYDRMATEMLAGDELAPTDPNTLRATGFLVRNWEKFNRNSWLEATIEHTAKAFLGVTMNCCRCHDHKFDPISQVEYFQFRAIFEPHEVRTERVPGQADVLQDGLPRVCDMKVDAPTYLLEKGDEKRPKKDKSLKPGVPEALGAPLKITPVDLPVTAYYPALQEFAIQDDLASAAKRMAEAQSALIKAQAEVAALAKNVAAATGKQENKPTSELTKQSAPADKPPTFPTEAMRKALEGAPAAELLQFAVNAAELADKQLATANAAHASLAARIAADKSKYGLTPGADSKQLALAAGKAERQLALSQAQERAAAAANELAVAKFALKPNDAKSKDAVATAETMSTQAAVELVRAHSALAEPSDAYKPLGDQLPHQSTGRRLAFAKWLVDRQNPLAARVAINHIWLRHFGAPLVDNMFDFGLRSPQPRNQPLLDWLAVELMHHGWQMKHIHRLLVTSNTYRMASVATDSRANNMTIDRDNRYLWRMNSRRLEAEIIRDSIFFTAGNLDLTRGGPDFTCALASTTPRRSIYFQHAYEKQSKFLELFDAASVNECYRRSESVVPQQALALANSDVTLNESRLLARKLSELVAKEKGKEPDQAFVLAAYQQILGRVPSTAELTECHLFLRSQAELLHDQAQLTAIPGGAKAAVAASTDPVQRARENLTLVLYNHNDFVTIH